jgi:tetratricopeptide (TPR) repeat protein
MDASQTPPSQSGKSSRHSELVADPSRQALPLLKGIDYQIWQTVLAWMDLCESEILVVEGAEDFDVISQSSASVNQVKNLTSPISLRSGCVCDALRNFWTARHKNPGHKIRLRLITTATFTVEAGAPFGASKPGLELWNEEALSATAQHSKNLKDFLLSDESISKRLAKPLAEGVPSLLDHLRHHTPETFRADFIGPIQWLPRQPDVEVIRDIVQVRLHAYGEDKHLLPRDSERALTPLFEHVAHVAIRQRRVLTREDFRVLFDDSTRLSMPISVFNRMQAAAASMQPNLPSTSLINFAVTEPPSIPDLPAPCAKRLDTVNALAKCVEEHKFVAIQGSTGKGKSTLAKLAAQKLGGNWLWVSCAGRNPQQIADELYRLAHCAAGQSDAPSLLIDDFNPKSSDLPFLLQKLSVLSRLTLARKGRMIVTTQRLLGEAFLRQSNLRPEVLQQVVGFSEDEVKELCVQSGCAQDQRLISWVNIVSTQTGRHPQLVHARVKVASRRGWPTPNINDVLETPQEISDERQLARRLLQELDDSEFELIYRLSIATQPFRKDQAIAVAEISPPISRAGEKFDALVGPWVESAGKKYFRLSQLLSRIAEENWTPEHVKTMRVEYALAIHRTRDRTLLEANEILFQAVLTKEAGLAGRVLPSLVSASVKSRKVVAQWLDWILVLPEPSAIFPDTPFVGYLFTLLQFRVAVASQSASSPMFAELLFKEANKSIAPEVDSYSVVGAATDIIIAMQVAVSPELLLQAWLTVRRYTIDDKRLGMVARSLEAKRRESGLSLGRQSFDQMLFGFILNRRGGDNYFRQFISAVDCLPDEDRAQVISTLKANYFGLVGFVDDVWMHELGKEKADWVRAIAELGEAHLAGERWCFPELCGIAARGIAAVQDEYLQNPGEALKVLDATGAKFGDSLMVRYQRGTVHFLAKRYSQAFEAWLSTFNEWPTDDEIAAIYAFNAFSNCGAAAGFLEKWDDAASAFEKGHDLALKVRRKFDALKFGMDAAYAQWRAGQKKQALSKFVGCLTEMEQLSRTDKSTEFHTVWKIMEHLAVWFKSDAGAPHNLEIITPRPGICSEAKSKERHDLVKDKPRAPVLMSWYNLVEAELYAGLGRETFCRISVRNDLHNYPNLQSVFDFLRARRALADREFKLIPVFAELSSLAFSKIDVKSVSEKTLFQQSKPASLRTAGVPSTARFVEESILCALLVAAAEDIPWDILLKQWRAGAERMQSPAILTEAIDTIERICRATPMEMYFQYATNASPRFCQIVACIQFAVHPATTPQLCYVGLCLLVIDVGFATNMMFSHNALAKLTRKAWLKRLSSQFDLLSPQLTVPAIKTACESNKNGLPLAATILLAAGDAVSVTKIPSNLIPLQKLSGGFDGKATAQI